MDINNMLANLRGQRENLEQAIITLGRLAAWQTPGPTAGLDDSGEGAW
jgi:hypothetical protein